MAASDQVAKQEAHAYPPLPGVFNVPQHLIRPWATAQSHIWLIQLYLDGLDAFAHHPELTTGPPCSCTDQPDIWCPRDDHARHALGAPPGCTCRDARWYPGRPDNPACPIHSHVRPCNCYYGLHDVHSAPGPWEQYRVPGIRRPRWLTRCFVIVWDCPHHGDDRLDQGLALDDLYGDAGGVWGFTLADCVLDDDERAGH